MRGDPGKGEARIVVGDEAHAERGGGGCDVRMPEHRDGAARHRVFHEFRAVHLAAGQCREQIAGLDLAAVAREPGEFSVP